MAEEEPQPLTYVHETVLKKRKNNEEWAIKRREQLEARKKRNKRDLKFAIKRPEEFVKEYCDKELDHIRMKQRLKLRKLASDSLKSELLFVIRIRGSRDMHPRTRKILDLLRLRHFLSGVFVKASEATLKMLLSVEPFITYGYPNLKSVRELIYKKGCGMIDKQRVPLTNNNVIEQALGKYGIICIEDIVHEIATVGSHFKEVTKFLWPFKLKAPERRLQLKKKPHKDGGDSGNREERINELIDKFN
ncbi:60S ribosomal protein L7-2-like [Phoenix dactylifera]|uniref:60S ribosomal protein L7-2-like n=1 Tax=Phoenix dactylifera TaxID=42345 RepID=A0A8B7BMZ9_PHODC|nr:60S ribosomal protein L7-2-like [Phoenix dactylifera]XP_038984772.1 60S ribosomal protein L7-2-like [Phoenix dactylifera]